MTSSLSFILQLVSGVIAFPLDLIVQNSLIRKQTKDTAIIAKLIKGIAKGSWIRILSNFARRNYVVYFNVWF